jgi:hypothetical protein
MSANVPQERPEFQKHDSGQSRLLGFLMDPRAEQVLKAADKDHAFAADIAATIAEIAACEERGIERCLEANVIEILARMIAKHPNVERVNRNAAKALGELLGNDPHADQAEEKRRSDHVCDLFVAANLPAALVSMIKVFMFECGVSSPNSHAILTLHFIFQSSAQNAQHCVIAGAGPVIKEAQKWHNMHGRTAEQLQANCAAHPDAPSEPIPPSGE